MGEIHEFLKKTETHFNWDLHSLDVTDLNWGEKFREKIQENRALDDPSEMIWPLKLTYAFELFATDKEECNNMVDGAIEEIYDAQDGLTCKYRTSYLHIALSFKAFVLIKSHEGGALKVAKMIERIKSIADMSPIEKSAVLAMKAQVLTYYGGDGTYRSVPLQREAIRLNPKEIEFKLALVVSMNRTRHIDKSMRMANTWSTVEEPVNILEQLLNHPDLTSKQRVSCEYFLAVAYNDFIKTLNFKSPEYQECKIQILKSCNWIHDKTDHPQIMSFCASRFFYLEKDKPKGLRVLEEALELFPFHVGLNTMASTFYEKTTNFNSAAKHAQIALDGGGICAAWLLLRLKTKLDEVFDEDEYFNKLLQLFPKINKKEIHLNASLYYLQFKHDVVQGARHIEMILDYDPSYYALRSTFSNWAYSIVRPLEMAFGMIVEELKGANHSKEDLSTLRNTKAKIEEFANVDNFDLTYYRSEMVPVGRVVGDSQESSGDPTKTANGNTWRGFYIRRSGSNKSNGGNEKEGAPDGRGVTSNCKTSTSAGSSCGREVASKRWDGTYSQQTSGAKEGAPTNTRYILNTPGAAPNIDQKTYHRGAASKFTRGASKSPGWHAAEGKYHRGRGGFADNS